LSNNFFTLTWNLLERLQIEIQTNQWSIGTLDFVLRVCSLLFIFTNLSIGFFFLFFFFNEMEDSHSVADFTTERLRVDE